MSAPPKTPSAKAAPLHLHEPTQEELKKEQLERHEGWRVMLFRSIKEGNLKLVKWHVERHPFVIFDSFTKGLQPWELEWETIHWYEFLDCTCLYVAVAFARLSVVEYLLDRGSDPTTKCYYGQVALDVVGEVRYDSEDVVAITKLLKQPQTVPRPPVPPTAQIKIGYEDIRKTVMEEVPSDDPKMPTQKVERRVTETIIRCKMVAQWKTTWLGPQTEYEMRYRLKRDGNWRYEKTHSTSKAVTMLLPGSVYEVQVRASNSVGWSEYSEMVEFETPTAGDEESDTDSEADEG